MASVTCRSSSIVGREDSNTTSHSYTLPATISAGDLLIWILALDGAGTITTWDAGTFTGWTEITDATDGNVSLSIAWKKADGTEDSSSATATSSASEKSCGIIYSFYNTANPAIYPPAGGTAATGSSATADPPQGDPSWGSRGTNSWLTCCAVDGNSSITGYPDVDNNLTDTNGSSTGCAIAACTRENDTNSYNPPPFTNTNEQWVSQTICIPNDTMASEVQLRSSNTVSTSGDTTVELVMPLTISAGDLIIAIFTVAGVQTVSAWSTLTALSVDSTASGDTLCIGYKKADGTEDGTTITVTVSSTASGCAIIYCFSNVYDPAVMPPEIATAATGHTAKPNSASVSPSWGATGITWWITTACSNIGGSNSVTGWPTGGGWCDRLSHDTPNTEFLAACGHGTTAASDDPPEYSFSNSGYWVAQTIAIPSSGATPPGGTSLKDIIGQGFIPFLR